MTAAALKSSPSRAPLGGNVEGQRDLQPSLRRAWIDGEIPRVDCGGRALGASQHLVSNLVVSSIFPPNGPHEATRRGAILVFMQ